tara:strand:- start:359 stop:751 length:393 start_codon:yes stop_codon:yes gene_type:complete
MKNKLSHNQLRQFGFLIGFVFPILIGWIIPSIGGHAFRVWTLYIGIPFFVLGLFKAKLLKKPYILWIKIGDILGWINSKIILGLLFFIVLQPIALIMRIFGYDPLKLKKNNLKTYRENIENNVTNFEKIF